MADRPSPDRIRDARPRHPFTVIDHELIDQHMFRMGPDAFAVYVVLCRFAGSSETAWPAVSTIVAKTQLGRSTVHRVLKRLADTGYIAIEQQYSESGQTSNLYTILPLPGYHDPLPPGSGDLSPEESPDPRPAPGRGGYHSGTGGIPLRDGGGTTAGRPPVPERDTNKIHSEEDTRKKIQSKVSPKATTPAIALLPGLEMEPVTKTWPPAEPSRGSAIAHLLWRIEIVNGIRFPRDAASRNAKVAGQLLEVATEEEIVACYVQKRRDNEARNRDPYLFRYLADDLGGMVARIRKAGAGSALQRDIDDEEAAFASLVATYAARAGGTE